MEWYCVRTKPLKEEFAIRYCRDILGLEIYCPKLMQKRVIRRVRRTVIKPLFPRYWFCRFDLQGSYRAVRYAPEVIDIVHSGGAPTVVMEGLIHDLKLWAGKAFDVVTLQPSLKPGDEVVITSGIMSGLRAILLKEMSDGDRVEVLLSVLNCGARMVVDRPNLERVG